MTVLLQNPGVVKIDNAAGTLADISDQVVSCTLTHNMTVGSYHVISTQWQQQTQGALPKVFELSLTIIKDDTATTGAYDIIQDWCTGTATASTAQIETGLKTVELYDPDAGIGSEKWTGEFMLVSAGAPVTKNASSGDAQQLTVTLRSHNAVTRTTVT
jgi:hypothetical protein